MQSNKSKIKVESSCACDHDNMHLFDEKQNVGNKKHEHETAQSHEHEHDESNSIRAFLPAIFSLIILLIGIALDNWIPQEWFKSWIRIFWYLLAYIPVGFPVVKDAFKSIIKGDVFSEFLLMTIATFGAFAIGELPEAVAVMLFYAVGEAFQGMAVKRAKANIKSLLDQRPDEVTILENGNQIRKHAADVQIGSVVLLKPGEQIALDGVLMSDSATFNTAALTGESKPDLKLKNDLVLAGMININSVAEIKVTTLHADSKLSKILEMVQNASQHKAPTELFIRKFAKIYTPIVVLLAILISVLPALWVDNYMFSTWLYRALVFLVISCPCALVISIPLGYFGGIGAASKNGILVKGSNYLDVLAKVKGVVMDKTGTMTEGVFKVQEVVLDSEFDEIVMLKMVNALEAMSTHPVATAIRTYVGDVDKKIELKDVKELPGKGLKATVEGGLLLVGNTALMDEYAIAFNKSQFEAIVDTTILIAYKGEFVGYITIADAVKSDAKLCIDQLKGMDITPIMLSGDKSAVVQKVADQLGIKNAFGDLLPDGKVEKFKHFSTNGDVLAFVGDGVNDAPVVALSDVGIAMGGLGSDATIETADVVIQDDKPSKIPMAIKIGKQTQRIVWQNIVLAFGVKLIVLILGAGGLATMWEAVFADVGVALLAILNAVRIQRMAF